MQNSKVFYPAHLFVLLTCFFSANAAAQSILEKNLQNTYEIALSNHANILAPRAWPTAAKKYQRAMNAIAVAPGEERNDKLITDALAQLTLANNKSLRAKSLIAGVLKKRDAALRANANTMASKDWQRGEKLLKSLTSDLERGRLTEPSKLQSRSSIVIATFDIAELDALTNQLLIRARGAEALASFGNAEKLAPKTFGRAEKSLQAAILSMQQHRYDNAEAIGLADQAESEFKHATQLTLMVQQIRNKQLSTEDLLLIWENRLLKINAAAGLDYDALNGWDTTAESIVDHINNSDTRIIGLQSLLTESRAYIGSLEDELRLADQQLGGTLAQRDELIVQQEQQARSLERLIQLEKLFEPTEASVIREGRSIVLRLTGLQFASGSSALNDASIQLLKKVDQAVIVYPDSVIMVEGHTDASGPQDLNARLSEDRANTVMRYMISDMRIEPRRLNAIGYGSNRPITLNNSAAGRAENRRIDLVITPTPEASRSPDRIN